MEASKHLNAKCILGLSIFDVACMTINSEKP